MTFKHIEFYDSPVMRELARIAEKKGWVTAPTLEKQASELEPQSESLLSDLAVLANGLRDRGLIAQAESLEEKIFKFCKEKSLLDEVHPEGDVEVVPSAHGYGKVEQRSTQQQKMLEIVNKKPHGKLASEVAAALGLNKSADADSAKLVPPDEGEEKPAEGIDFSALNLRMNQLLQPAIRGLIDMTDEWHQIREKYNSGGFNQIISDADSRLKEALNLLNASFDMDRVSDIPDTEYKLKDAFQKIIDMEAWFGKIKRDDLAKHMKSIEFYIQKALNHLKSVKLQKQAQNISSLKVEAEGLDYSGVTKKVNNLASQANSLIKNVMQDLYSQLKLTNVGSISAQIAELNTKRATTGLSQDEETKISELEQEFNSKLEVTKTLQSLIAKGREIIAFNSQYEIASIAEGREAMSKLLNAANLMGEFKKSINLPVITGRAPLVAFVIRAIDLVSKAHNEISSSNLNPTKSTHQEILTRESAGKFISSWKKIFNFAEEFVALGQIKENPSKSLQADISAASLFASTQDEVLGAIKSSVNKPYSEFQSAMQTANSHLGSFNSEATFQALTNQYHQAYKAISEGLSARSSVKLENFKTAQIPPSVSQKTPKTTGTPQDASKRRPAPSSSSSSSFRGFTGVRAKVAEMQQKMIDLARLINSGKIEGDKQDVPALTDIGGPVKGVNATPDGIWGTNTSAGLKAAIKYVGELRVNEGGLWTGSGDNHQPNAESDAQYNINMFNDFLRSPVGVNQASKAGVGENIVVDVIKTVNLKLANLQSLGKFYDWASVKNNLIKRETKVITDTQGLKKRMSGPIATDFVGFLAGLVDRASKKIEAAPDANSEAYQNRVVALYNQLAGLMKVHTNLKDETIIPESLLYNASAVYDPESGSEGGAGGRGGRGRPDGAGKVGPGGRRRGRGRGRGGAEGVDEEGGMGAGDRTLTDQGPLDPRGNVRLQSRYLGTLPSLFPALNARGRMMINDVRSLASLFDNYFDLSSQDLLKTIKLGVLVNQYKFDSKNIYWDPKAQEMMVKYDFRRGVQLPFGSDMQGAVYATQLPEYNQRVKAAQQQTGQSMAYKFANNFTRILREAVNEWFEATDMTEAQQNKYLRFVNEWSRRLRNLR